MDDGVVRGPALPTRMPAVAIGENEDVEFVSEWPEQTRSWWETWRRSPQAQGWGATDWDFLLDSALLHARLWLGDAKVAAELRLRVAKFGATPEDRMRLREVIAVSAGDSPAPAPSPSAPARRDRILKAVGDGA